MKEEGKKVYIIKKIKDLIHIEHQVRELRVKGEGEGGEGEGERVKVKVRGRASEL